MQIGSTHYIFISRTEANFDRACDEAYKSALIRFGIDEYGHSNCIEEWERNSCLIEVTFNNYVRMGNNHRYQFSAIALKSDGI